MATIFFSYSHRDEDLRDRLDMHLALMKRQDLIESWHDRQIPLGGYIDDTIDQALEAADIVLLLVSPDFIASEYCYGIEMKRALERHQEGSAHVVPIILRHCDWHAAPFGALRAAPKDGRPITSWPDLDEAFLDVVKGLRALLSQKPAAVLPARPTAQARIDNAPRSGNLRIRKAFTEADRDRYLTDAFAFMARFFENSLQELDRRNVDIETSFRRLDANRFTGVIYRGGAAMSRCSIVLGGMFDRGITFSYDDRGSENSCNESLSVEADEHGLFLNVMGLARLATGSERKLTHEGAAEYYWSLFIEPLQRH